MRLSGQINRAYKSSVFSMLFHEPSNLLLLYNAVNHTDYTAVEDLSVNTLGDHSGIFAKFRNDISFIFWAFLNIYEHQSTPNPNMPLRDLFYFADLVLNMIRKKQLYSEQRITLPTPRFVVFYNGISAQPEKSVYLLSDLFEHREQEPEVELKVTVYNINAGMNPELMQRCRPLQEYAVFVQLARGALGGLTSETEKYHALSEVIESCIRNNILREFLIEHKSEVISVYYWEFDEDAYREAMEDDKRFAVEEARRQALAEGEQQGRNYERRNTERERHRADAMALENQRLRELLIAHGVADTAGEYQR